MKRSAQVLVPGPQLRYAESIFDAATGADAVLVLTDWKEFGAIDLGQLKSKLRYPIVVDGRNMFDPKTMAMHGFTYLSVGRPIAHPPRGASGIRPAVKM